MPMKNYLFALSLFVVAAASANPIISWKSKDSNPNSRSVVYHKVKVDGYVVRADNFDSPNLELMCESLGHDKTGISWTTQEVGGYIGVRSYVSRIEYVRGQITNYRLVPAGNEIFYVLDSLSCEVTR